MKRLLYFFVAVVLLLSLTACGDTAYSTPPVTTPPVTTSTAPAELDKDFTLSSLDGRTVTLSQLQGKTVVLNFMATWCGFCVEELPAFLNVQETCGENVVILFIDTEESKETVEAFRTKQGYENFDPLLDLDGTVAAAYKAFGFPTTIVLNAQGQIVSTQRGAMTEDDLRAAIEAAATT